MCTIHERQFETGLMAINCHLLSMKWLWTGNECFSIKNKLCSRKTRNKIALIFNFLLKKFKNTVVLKRICWIEMAIQHLENQDNYQSLSGIEFP